MRQPSTKLRSFTSLKMATCRGGPLTRLNDTSSLTDPLTYPLIFPTGKFGWHIDLRKTPTGRRRKRISQREFYSYLLQVRQRVFNPILLTSLLWMTVPIPFSVQGSPRAIIQNYQDAM